MLSERVPSWPSCAMTTVPELMPTRGAIPAASATMLPMMARPNPNMALRREFFEERSESNAPARKRITDIVSGGWPKIFISSGIILKPFGRFVLSGNISKC